MNSLLAKKIEQSQKFLENGTRIPVTKLGVDGNIVLGIKTPEKNMYSAVQLGFGKKKKKTSKGTKTNHAILREIRIKDEDSQMPNIGDAINASDIFKVGDVINITGVSKGKGFAGGVKRYNFRGGPRTHGQSDRERAPGSIGSSTTPGRVYKGKRMAGRMGHDQVTVRNLTIVSVDNENILVTGLVPGGRNSLLIVKKVSENKKFVPLFTTSEEKPEEAKESVSAVQNDEAKQEIEEPKKESEEKKEAKAKEAPEVQKEEKKEEVKEDAK